MKSKNEKQKKKLETNIGKIIYGFLLFMPLLAIGVTCAYAIFNKNAYQSYMGSADYLDTLNYKDYIEKKPINANTYTLNENTYYYYSSTSFNNIEINSTDIRNQIYNAGYIMFNCNSFVYNETEYTNVKSVVLTQYEYNFTFFAYDIVINNDYFYVPKITGNNNYGLYYLTTETPIEPTYTTTSIYSGKINLRANLTLNNIYSNKTINDAKNYYNYSNFDLYLNDTTISSVFYHSINKVEQSNLFNWSKNSLIYTGISNTAQALDISNTFIPMLLTYWLIISVFYYLYDIILIILNVFHRKIHELEESI